MNRDIRDYRDIIDMPHHQSETRPHMSNADRAAQFSPFAALTGYDDAVEEAARLTDERFELSEYRAAVLSEKMDYLCKRISEHPRAGITYFVPDGRKEGGSYVTKTGRIRKIDGVKRVVVFDDKSAIAIEDIFDIEIEGDVHAL